MSVPTKPGFYWAFFAEYGDDRSAASWEPVRVWHDGMLDFLGKGCEEDRPVTADIEFGPKLETP